MVIPVGMFALADYLVRNGVDARIVHVGLERLRDPGFSLVRYVADGGFDCAAFDLHWAGQVVDVLESARELKHAFPSMPVVFGGLSATHWASELAGGVAAVGRNPVALRPPLHMPR